MRLTVVSKVIITAAIVGAVVGCFKFAQSKGWVAKAAVSSQKTFASAPKAKDPSALKVGVVTWGGYVGGQYFNKGFQASEESRFYKEYGMKVEFIVNDDFASSRDAWKAGEVDILWGTADSFPIEAAALAEFKPRVIFQVDWSRGGDAIVTKGNIRSVADLKGKRVAFAFGTPSHTFLLWMLKAGDMTQKDIIPVETDSAVQAAQFFKSGNVDAAVVWSPDDEDCLATVSDAKILKSTREASNIIADVLFAKEEFINANKEKVAKFVEGFLRGAGEVNSNPAAKREAVEILKNGLNIPAENAEKAINNTRLATYGDNLKFFGIDRTNNPTTGEFLYTKMNGIYQDLKIAQGRVPSWRSVADSTILTTLNLKAAGQDAAEGAKAFTAPTKDLEKKEAFSTQRVSVSFPSGSAVLSEDNKYLIQEKFGDVARSFGNARVRIEGNTDSVGSASLNKELSLRRAKAIAAYLTSEYGFHPNRFIIVGNGAEKPLADNATDEGRAQNRRTDFELVGN